MTQKPNIIRPRAALFIGAALLATPAFAQDASQSVAPPPIMVAPPQAAAPAPQAQPERVIRIVPSEPVVQAVPSVEEQQARGPEPTAAATPARRASASTTSRQTTRSASSATPARTSAPAQAEAPVTAPAAPVAITETPAQPVEATRPPSDIAASAPSEQPVDGSSVTTQRSTGIAWPWLAGGVLLVIAGIAALLMMGRRRRNDDVETTYAEPAYERPVAVVPAADEAVIVAPEPRGRPVYASPLTAPVIPAARAPIDPIVAPKPVREPELATAGMTEAHEEIEVARAKQSDLEGIADAAAPVANRPWLEFGLRPVRAGTSEEEALVDVELTIGNSGDTAARDVRISTFMLADADSSEMEQLLMEHRSDANVPPVTIAPGDGTRLDAHLAVPKGELGRVFNPIVVAEARYTLPDGSEGHTQAAFKIGRPAPSADGVGPIGATRPHMVESLEAELLGVPEHA